MRKLMISLVVLCVAVSAAWAQFTPPADRNSNGIGYFMVEVPDPGAMVMDGSDADWAWFPADYKITMDQLVSEQGNPLPDPDEFEISCMMGWSPVPDNMWYLFSAVHDDTLDIESTDPNNPWSDDVLEMAFDPTDHGRGDTREYGQCFTIKAETFLSPSYPIWTTRVTTVPEAWQELCRPPYAEGAVATNPPEARNSPIWTSDTGVDIYFEFKMAVWDHALEDGPVSSPRTILQAGNVLPFNLWWDDGDGPWVSDITTRSNTAAAVVDGYSYFATATLLSLEDVGIERGVAVESSTWGALKATFQQ